MNVIEQPNKDILLLLGENPFYKNKKYRFNKYCLTHDYKGVKLIHNAMTRSTISITDEELEKINDLTNVLGTREWEYIDFLISSYFLVLEDFNEAEQTDWLRTKFIRVVDDKYLSEVYDYVIYPTTTCNARCFYCYEKPMKKMPMSMEMAEKVAQYILKKAVNKERSIMLRWFGGEPLFNVKAIRHIISVLKNNGRSINSTIISNGYLFSDKLVDEAVNEWNLSSAQITLDGTEEVYNKAKNYIYTNQDKVSPFKKVIDNIERLTSKGVSVNIRMNADIYNYQNLKELVKFLYTRFPENEKLGIYVYPIFEDNENPRTPEEREELFNKIWEVEDVMKEYGFLQGNSGMGSQIRFHHCMVDGGGTLNIHPDGTLGLCEHYIDTDILGNIDDDVYDFDIIKSWREYETDEHCKNCSMYPSCLRAKKCSDLRFCDDWFQEFRMKHTLLDLEATYDDYMSNKNSCNSTRCGVGTCYCVSQRCDDNENLNTKDFICASNETDGTCYCISQRCEDKENWCLCISKKEEGLKQGECYCVSQRCDDKENWCYCISKKEETEHKCEGGSCTCKKEEQKQEEPKKKSLWKKIKDIFE